MEIGILVFPECVDFSVNGLYSIMNYGLQLSSENSSIIFISAEKEKTIAFDNGISICCKKTIYETYNPDIIFVPGVGPKNKDHVDKLTHITNWIVTKHNAGATLAVSCSGIFLVAQGDILQEKKVVTHWKLSTNLKELYSIADIEDKRIIIDHGSIILSGGTGIFMNLAVYVLERFFGRKIAIQTANHFMIDINKYPQSAYADIFMPKSHGNEIIAKAETIISSSVNNAISVDKLANKLCMSPRNLNRKFKQYTGYAPLEYIQRKKLQLACEALIFTTNTVDNICFELGYSDTASFRKLFKKHIGISAKTYRERYCQRVVSLA